MTDIVIRRADDADVPALATLRREWTHEWGGAGDDPGFAERFAAWFEQERERQVTWLAESDGRAVGMVNLTVFERMPQPARAPSCGAQAVTPPSGMNPLPVRSPGRA